MSSDGTTSSDPMRFVLSPVGNSNFKARRIHNADPSWIKLSE
jgi:hypothetical protein